MAELSGNGPSRLDNGMSPNDMNSAGMDFSEENTSSGKKSAAEDAAKCSKRAKNSESIGMEGLENSAEQSDEEGKDEVGHKMLMESATIELRRFAVISMTDPSTISPDEVNKMQLDNEHINKYEAIYRPHYEEIEKPN